MAASGRRSALMGHLPAVRHGDREAGRVLVTVVSGWDGGRRTNPRPSAGSGRGPGSARAGCRRGRLRRGARRRRASPGRPGRRGRTVVSARRRQGLGLVMAQRVQRGENAARGGRGQEATEQPRAAPPVLRAGRHGCRRAHGGHVRVSGRGLPAGQWQPPPALPPGWQPSPALLPRWQPQAALPPGRAPGRRSIPVQAGLRRSAVHRPQLRAPPRPRPPVWSGLAGKAPVRAGPRLRGRPACSARRTRPRGRARVRAGLRLLAWAPAGQAVRVALPLPEPVRRPALPPGPQPAPVPRPTPAPAGPAPPAPAVPIRVRPAPPAPAVSAALAPAPATPALAAPAALARAPAPGHSGAPVRPAATGRAQRGEQLAADLGRALRGQRAVLGHDVPQRPGGHEFHHDPRPPAVFHDVVDRDHVRVAEPRRGPGLPQGALPEHGTLRLGDVEGRRDLLDRYLTVEQLVGGQPHRAHAATAEFPDQPVPPGDDPAGLRRHSHSPRITP